MSNRRVVDCLYRGVTTSSRVVKVTTRYRVKMVDCLCSMVITGMVKCKEVESTLGGCALFRVLVCYCTVFTSCHS